MRLRPIASGDLERVRLLRNQSRESFFDSREISAARQREWFENLRSKPTTFFVIEEDGVVVGTISVTARVDDQEIGNIILDPAYRGRGLMRRAVEQLTAAPGDYFADVKAGNTPSLNVFRATGFSEEPAGDVVLLRKRVAEPPRG
jgi:RimJ/RimL family protein N-acetyltransferase